MSFKPQQHEYGRRLIAAKMLVCFALGLIGVRLWYLQGVQGPYYRDLSENNRTRTIRTAAPRGTIYDREGRVLVRNRPAFDIALMVEDTPDVDIAVMRLAQIVDQSPNEVLDQFTTGRRSRPFEPKVVLSDVSRVDLARVKVNSHQLPGVIVATVPTRTYPNGELAAQLFGYTREISKEQLAKYGPRYRLGDSIGQTGLEKHYEDTLRGEAGYLRVEVDARGTRKGELGIVDEQVGSDLHLTLDIDLQRAAQDALGEKRGAVVALDPRNGEILALASSPTFDANILSGQVTKKDWDELRKDGTKPLTNRVHSHIYPPGSTMKLMYAVAGLQEKLVSPETKFNCPGYFQLGRRRYHCHKKTGHGKVDLRTAITVSCNSYFYQLGQALGIERLSRYLSMFGFGEPSGIDLPGEEKGVRPSAEWKKRTQGERWYPGDTIPVSIGQGYLATTPLQLAAALGALVNGGTYYQPRLIQSMVEQPSGAETVFGPTIRRRLPVQKEVFDLVREYAGDVVNHQRGTGKRAGFASVRVGGKTGTAQVRAGAREFKQERFKDHAWFIGFAPVEDPQIALAVIVENSGHGGSHAAPVARKVMRVFFRKKGILSDEDWAIEDTSIPEEVAPVAQQVAPPAVTTNATQQGVG